MLINNKLPSILRQKKLQKTLENEIKIYNFVLLYFRIMFNGLRMVWKYDAKKLKIEVPKNRMKKFTLLLAAVLLALSSTAQKQVINYDLSELGLPW